MNLIGTRGTQPGISAPCFMYLMQVHPPYPLHAHLHSKDVGMYEQNPKSKLHSKAPCMLSYTLLPSVTRYNCSQAIQGGNTIT